MWTRYSNEQALMLAGTETLATIANHWLARFEHALASGDRALLESLFHSESHWRDVLALTWRIGTLEELFEVWSWAQLGLHRKPCGVLDVEGFFAPLVEFLDRQVEAGFIHPTYRAMLTVASAAEELLDAFSAYKPPADKWTASVRRA